MTNSEAQDLDDDVLLEELDDVIRLTCQRDHCVDGKVRVRNLNDLRVLKTEILRRMKFGPERA